MNKKIYDPIHKYMEFEPLLINIIDTYEFQRLRNIKQLGVCYYVFSGASHNRFEHSLGVSFLSGKLLNILKNNQPELEITDRQILLVKIAGLIHDLGHACFSHFFDNYFIKNKFRECGNANHEIRSCWIFETIIKKYNLDISNDEVTFIKNVINPIDSSKSFLFQIINNKLTEIDCDKFDYLLRDTYNIGLPYSFDYNRFFDNVKVIDNKICFSEKLYYDIYDLFNLRFRLHKQIYNHHTINQIELMLLDIFNKIDDDFKISSYIFNLDNFIKLTDNIIDNILIHNQNNERIQYAKVLLMRIKERKLYKLVDHIIVEKKEIPEYILRKYNNFTDLNYTYIFNKINFCNGNQNPLNKVWFYNKENNIFNKKSNDLEIYPNKFEEIHLKIFKKN